MTDIGPRIRQVRLERRMSASSLADAIGVDASALSRIESGERSVKTGELLRICDALDVSATALLEPDSLPARLPVSARVPTDLQSEPVVSTLRWVAEMHHLLDSSGIPAEPTGLPDVPKRSSWLAEAEEMAGVVRSALAEEQWGEQRFSGLKTAIEQRLRIPVMVGVGGGSLLGASITDSEFPFIYVNAQTPRPRALFTLAHELGHVLQGDGEVLRLETTFRSAGPSERFANAFAAELLAPSEAISAAVVSGQPRWGEMARLMSQFDVSYETFTYRLHNLGYVNAQGRDALLTQAGRQALMRQLDQETERKLLSRNAEHPAKHPPIPLLRRMLDGYRKGVVSVNPVAELLEIDPDDLLAILTPADSPAENPFAAQASPEADTVRYAGSPL